MKRINSIYRIFVLFLIIIVGSFLILYWYSSANLKVSLQRVAKIQMEYSFDQLDQKVKEIELEASAVLASEDMKLLQVAIVDQEDIYSYVMKVKTMQQIFQEKQKQIPEWQSLHCIGPKHKKWFLVQVYMAVQVLKKRKY